MARSQKVEDTAERIHSAAIRLLRFVRREDAGSGISPAQLSALSVLVFGGPQTVTALAAAEQVKLPTMSQLVATLEKKGLALRTPIDRRSSRITATEKGRRLMVAGRKRRLARLSAALADFPPRELALLGEAARMIVQATEPQTINRYPRK